MSVAIGTDSRSPRRAGAGRRFTSIAIPLLLVILAATAIVALTVGAAGIPSPGCLLRSVSQATPPPTP